MGDNANRDLIAELRKAEEERLFQLADCPEDRPDQVGVLLSDRIRRYCRDCGDYRLIDPFHDDLLRPASYTLTVGRNYSYRGERRALTDGRCFEIGPYQVAVIETYETINMPPFLIGRWNVQVGRAYQGLLWVGGAQVDPGFRGLLCCPIYNLSKEPVPISFRAELAVIDFVATTPYNHRYCKRFSWKERKRLVFDDYQPLQSGIAEEVDKFNKTIKDNNDRVTAELTGSKEELRTKLTETNTRIDNFVTLTFTVVAVLFAALGIVASMNKPELSFFNFPVLVAATALYFALMAHARSYRWPSRVLGIAIVFVIGLLGIAYHAYDARGSVGDNAHLAKDQAAQTMHAIEQEKQDREAAIRQLRQESAANLERLREELRTASPAKR